MSKTGVGVTVIRKEAWNKVTGQAQYTDDFASSQTLTAKMATSVYAHALIKNLDISQATALPGVKAVLTGEDFPGLCGPLLEDRPPLAKGRVRYYGEPVALVVAENELIAAKAVSLIKITYEPLPVVASPSQAISEGATLIHEGLVNYKRKEKDVYPEPGSNVCDRKNISKGDIIKGFQESDVIIESSFTLPQSDHIAMETRAVRVKIDAEGIVTIKSSTQSPFMIKKEISNYFNLEEAKVIVEVPLVGGAFGGKSPVQLEFLAYRASKAVGGKEVRLVNTREHDIVSSPCRMGLEAVIKLGATKTGKLKAARITYLVDTGAYSDIGPRMAKAINVDCTGPYNIENIFCDSLCVYTNHPYATAFRGFGHASYTFCMERMMDKMARELNMDPSELRKMNALRPDQLTPTQVKVTKSNLGDLPACIDKVKTIINWQEGTRIELNNNKIRAKGIACLWKTSTSPTNAVSGACLTFNTDGSINLNCGCVEIGPSMKTTAAQILSEKLKMDIKHIHVMMDVNTQYSPKHWKTVASMTTYMVGNAVLDAAEDVIRQLKDLASTVMRYPAHDFEVENERVYLKQDPSIYLEFKDLVHGYQYTNGNSVGGQILGRGSFIMSGLSYQDVSSGKGQTGPAWTVGAQAVEIEFDQKEFSYRLVKAATVIDAGKVLNPAMAEGLIRGGMCMGLGLGSREFFSYDQEGRVQDTSLRTYKVMHFGENPKYLVDFAETPQIDAPYGARSLAEHGIIAIPAALGNALTLAAQVELDELPLTPEKIWWVKTGGVS